MRKCKNCQVTILDDTLICPLCSSVLEGEGEACYAPMYPNVKNKVRILNWLVRLYTFLAIIVEVVLIVVNVCTFRQVWWSAISGVAILYLYITLRFSIQKNKGYRRTIMLQVIGATLLTIAIDYIAGYRGWSVNFVVPSAVLLLDLAIFILMLVNKFYWQSYLLMQMFTVLVSIFLLFLWYRGVIWHPVVTIVAASVSGVQLLGTLILGDRKAINELKRRFHM